MNRRKALRLLGIMVATLGGTAVLADEITEPIATDDELAGSLFITDDTLAVSGWPIERRPMDFRFEADDLGSVIITREGKPDIVIPFTDIIKELED